MKRRMIFSAICASFLFAAGASAATFTVNVTTDSVDKKPGDGICRDSASKCSLRAAIMEANVYESGTLHTIYLTGGSTYELSLTTGTTDATYGDLDITGKLTIDVINNPAIKGKKQAIINGNDIDRIFHIKSPASVAIKNIKLTGGTVKEGYGGAVYNESGVVKFENCLITGNSAYAGGGIYNKKTLTLTKTTVDLNSALTGSGGGIFNEAALTINNSTITNNSAQSGYGGGLINNGVNTNAKIINSLFSSDHAKLGAGIFSNNGKLELYNTIIFNNTAEVNGGGIYNIGSTDIILKNVTVVGNDVNPQANDIADGVYNDSTSSYINIYNTIIANNGEVSCSGKFEASHSIIDDNCTVPGGVNNVSGMDPFMATYNLQPKSPAIDAGDSTLCTGILAYDQTGKLRDDFCDIGAVEFVGTCGDSYVHKGSGEECDDGNSLSGDGCSSECKFEPHLLLNGLDIDKQNYLIDAPAFKYNYENVVVGSEAKGYLQITNSGGVPLKISKMELLDTTNFELEANSCGSLTPEIMANDGCEIYVNFHPQDGLDFKTALAIASNDPAHSSILISLEGSGLWANIIADPANINFGGVGINKTVTEIITLTNATKVPIDISDMNISLDQNAGYSFISECNGDKSLGSCNINVTFNPLTTDLYQANVVIALPFLATPIVVPLSGFGVILTPKMVVDPSDGLDFGEVPVGKTNNKNFTILNSGTTDLNIANIVIAAGGSGKFTFFNDDCYKIAIGQSCKVSVTFAPTYSGESKSTLIVQSDDYNKVHYEYPLTGTGINPSISVTESVTMNTVVGKSTDAGITISNAGNANAHITIDSSKLIAPFELIGTCKLIEKNGDPCELKVKFAPTEVKNYAGQINITTNQFDLSSNSYKTFTVNISGTATAKPLPQILVDTSMAFGDVYKGSSKSQQLTIKNVGGEDLWLTKIDIPDGGSNFKFDFNAMDEPCTGLPNFPVVIKPDLYCNILVTFTPSQEGYLEAWLMITNNTGWLDGTATITLLGNGLIPVPKISTSATTLDFGELDLDKSETSKELALNIFNEGGDLLTVEVIPSDDNSYKFSVPDSCKTIAVGGHCQIVVVFMPLSSGTSETSFVIKSNDSQNPELKIGLIGKAVKASTDGNDDTSEDDNKDTTGDDKTTGNGDDGGAAVECGNGVVETGEDCDDGNTINTDACSNTSKTVTPSTTTGSDATTGGTGSSSSIEEDGGEGGGDNAAPAEAGSGGGCSLIIR